MGLTSVRAERPGSPLCALSVQISDLLGEAQHIPFHVFITRASVGGARGRKVLRKTFPMEGEEDPFLRAPGKSSGKS